MRLKSITLRLFILFALVSAACSLPVGGATPTSAPETPGAPPETATATPVPVVRDALEGDILFADLVENHPTGLMDNFEQRLEAGEWTEEEGLLKTLQYVVGQVGDNEINPSGAKIISYEGSSVVRAAADYIKNGPDEATRRALQALINRIFIDPATLERLSVPAGQSTAPGGARVARVQAQDPLCATLYMQGFPEDSTATCFEYNVVEVAGREYRLYIPVDLTTSDNRMLQAYDILEGIPTAVNTFLTYGDMPSADLVFTLLEDRVISSTQAATWMASPGGRCQIAIFPAFGAIADPEQAKQVIAHELFHCFQFENYYQKTLLRSSDWWVEGTAEFFSNVAYPTANAEHEYLPAFSVESLESSLVKIDYPSWLFFQFLANQSGNGAVINLIELMPESGGVNAQLTALASYPDIANLFHEFGKAYVEKTIQDAGGGNLPPSIMVNRRVIRLDESNDYTIPVGDFVLERYLLVFPEDTFHTLSDNFDSSLTVKIRPYTSRSADWMDMPETMIACEDRPYIWLGTSARGDGSEQTYTLTDEVEDRDIECDRCLVGNWRMNNDSFWAAFEANLSMAGDQFRPALQRFDGEVLLLFTERGNGAATYNGFDVNYTQTIPMGNLGSMTADATMRIQGDANFAWYTQSNVLYMPLVYAMPVYEPDLVLTMPDGSLGNLPVPMPPVQTPGTGPYICTPTTLQIDQMGNGMYILYDKVRP